ncbi:alpha,alpha-trehalose-phosphate synthase (UDP-forming) [Wickerhamomyces ciferrii]|uniref:Alpha,alpha-trehalose-phosphate synthase (UDP-forming) n=1 Tax=Wickerhamomyces ciferrii (strain ATCC 14091 / BCRC 22168 / CBS 111 / JCM 3599 / NBRC 0793 / NRRL Y-1031 F-60-10) TaxID=1206466 RepID=K0KQP7_WICCF|nr:alpha,alpha-trehalose-phosphate synthase (UDP-forming) [Wickerhamomyces ciferrii]CCH45391.1 alpha,alpha-trehalose-phosphate synthase (UDP-forming) [Wickerhamomyces ciferrii]
MNQVDEESIEELAQSHPITVPKQRTASINAGNVNPNGPQPPTTGTNPTGPGSILNKQSHEQFNTNNSSVEDFFYQSSNNSPNASTLHLKPGYTFGSAQSTTSEQPSQLAQPHAKLPDALVSAPELAIAAAQAQGVIPPKSETPFEDLKKNASQSNLSSLTGSLKSGTPNPHSLYANKSLSANGSSTFIPKSRVNSPPPNSVTEAKKSRGYDVGIPAVKRVHPRSNLKYRTDSFTENERTNEDISKIHRNSVANLELDDDYDSNRNFEIPKFGGVSNKKILHQQDKANIFEKSPFNVVEFAKGNGGLKNAINSSLEDGIVNDYTWLGTIGIPTDELPDSTKGKIVEKLRSEYHSESVLPSDFTFQGHYKNFCKQILWPTFHYQIPDNPNSKAFEDHSWEYYRSLNQDFADKIVEIYKEGDIIWVHDYHLLLVPEMVRSKLPNAKIGFFLHVSFPSSEVFRCFAQRENLLKGLLGANSVSFQTDEYARHFLQTCNKLLLADVSDDELRYKGQTVKVASAPVGIDAHKLIQQQHSDIVTNWRQLIRERWPNKKLVVARDKFDRIRGVKQKLLAYEIFLKKNPEYIESTVLIQVCLRSSATDIALETEIMSIVDRINSLSPNISNSQPVVFLHQDIDFTQYLALISEAELFIVSSMREGMNLTCHEFIVATNEKKSPLILSEFTGSAAVFTKGAILINPWDIKQVSKSYEIAFNYTPKEREENWKELYDVVMKQDCDYWVESSLKFIEQAWADQQRKRNYQTLNVENFAAKYKGASNKLFILNLAVIPTERILQILTELSASNDVYMLSTFKRTDLERIYRRVPNLGLIAENGGFIKIKRGGPWISVTGTGTASWIETTEKVANSFAERLPGSYVEIGEVSLKFHTEQVEDKERQSSSIGDLIFHVNNSDSNIHATVIGNTVVVQESDLTFKAVKFLINYITKTGNINEADIVAPASPVSPGPDKQNYFDFIPKKLDFLTVAGSSSLIFEPVLEYANGLNNIDNVFTIAFGGDVSNAKEHVEGLNELFTVLANVTEQ